jgi:hypothetical protein
MSAILATATEIHARLLAGEPPIVRVVGFSEGEVCIRWGVEGLSLDCPPEGAVELANAFDQERAPHGLAALLRAAAAFCAGGGVANQP